MFIQKLCRFTFQHNYLKTKLNFNEVYAFGNWEN